MLLAYPLLMIRHLQGKGLCETKDGSVGGVTLHGTVLHRLGDIGGRAIEPGTIAKMGDSMQHGECGRSVGGGESKQILGVELCVHDSN